jgi:hypothetical protein
MKSLPSVGSRRFSYQGFDYQLPRLLVPFAPQATEFPRRIYYSYRQGSLSLKSPSLSPDSIADGIGSFQVSKNKKEISFFTIPEYEQWKEETNDGRGWKIKYFKVSLSRLISLFLSVSLLTRSFVA